MKKALYVLLICMMSFTGLSAQTEEFALPSIISDHAVMQRNAEVRLWGWCPGSWNLKIVCSWAPNDTIQTSSDIYCKWQAYIHTPSERGPFQIRFYGWENKLVKEVNDILMGEVWLCSGQSNMEYCFMWRVDDAKDVKSDTSNKEIRFFKVSKAASQFPVDRIEGKWVSCSYETCQNFSVVAYYFGSCLNEKLQVPVGLIGSYWGGTAIEPWIPDTSFQLEKSLYDKAKKSEVKGWTPTALSSLYNAMIYPIINYSIKGVIWYQGEANNERAADYADMMGGLIRGWRNANHCYLPFYYVQIAPWNGYSGMNGALLREQQIDLMNKLWNVGMVSTSDLVNDISDIHPSLKKQVGYRLGCLALYDSYGQKDLKPFSPMLKDYQIKKDKIYLTTTAVGKLSCRGGEIKNFELLDVSGQLHPAKAKLMKNGTICVYSEGLTQPTGVRYCFHNDAVPNLFDINGLPLLPFRTDKK
jgi:sialate O-acetylesterase